MQELADETQPLKTRSASPAHHPTTTTTATSSNPSAITSSTSSSASPTGGDTHHYTSASTASSRGGGGVTAGGGGGGMRDVEIGAVSGGGIGLASISSEDTTSGGSGGGGGGTVIGKVRELVHRCTHLLVNHPRAPLAVSAAFCLACCIPSLLLKGWEYTPYDKHAVLKDIGFQLLPSLEKYQVILPLLLLPYAVASLAWMVWFPATRYIHLRRVLFLWGLQLLMQCVFMPTTKFPSPSPPTEQYCDQSSTLPGPPGSGGNPLRKGCELSTFIFSSYVPGFLTCALLWSYARPNRWWVVAGSWLYCLVGVVLVAATHYHYTVCIYLSVFLSVLVWNSYMAVVHNKLLLHNSRLLLWFERDAVTASAAVCDGSKPKHIHRAFLNKPIRPNVDDVPAIAEGIQGKQRYLHIAKSLTAATAFFGMVGGTMMLINGVANANRPLHHPPLWDLGFNIIPELKDFANVPNVLFGVCVGLTVVFAFSQPCRWTVLRRTQFIWAVTLILRCLTVPATYLPDPSPLCRNPEHDPGVTCGDLIFSGHTVGFLVCALTWNQYCSPTTRHRWLVVGGFWAFCVTCILSIVAARLHYTIDICLAIFITLQMYFLLNALLRNVEQRAKWVVLEWFERDSYWWDNRDMLRWGELQERLPIVDRDQELTARFCPSSPSSSYLASV